MKLKEHYRNIKNSFFQNYSIYLKPTNNIDSLPPLPFIFWNVATLNQSTIKHPANLIKLLKVSLLLGGTYSVYKMLSDKNEYNPAYAEETKDFLDSTNSGKTDNVPNNLQDVDFTKATIDLSNKHLNSEDLEYIQDKVLRSKAIGNIKWGTLPPNADKYIVEVENKIIANNQNYQSHPNDFVHGLLSSHVYHDVKTGETVKFDAKHHNAKHNNHLDGWKVQKSYDHMQNWGGYYSASYIKADDGYLVLAHRGTITNITDMFKEDSPWKANMIGIVGGNIVKQQAAAYVVTKEVAQYAREHNYNLSITGHSLGAWLAELSLLLCYKEKEWGYDIARNEVKAVTFDSPGSLIHMENTQSNINHRDNEFNIKNLDITTYLSPPNPINSINQHSGKVYIVPTKIPENGLIKLLLSKDNLHKASVSIIGHSLNLILDTFNPATGKPHEYKRVLDWPHIKANLKGDYIGNSIKQSVSLFSNDIEAQVISKFASSLVPDVTIASIANVLLAYFSGDIKTEQYFSSYKYQTGKVENLSSLERDTNNFYLKYQGHYELTEVDLYKDVLMKDNIASADYYLAQLISKDTEILKHELDSLVAEQLIALKDYYTIRPEDGKDKIVAQGNNKVEIDVLREQINRLMSFDPEIKNILYEYSSWKFEAEYKAKLYFSANIPLPDFVEPQNTNYVPRLLEDGKDIFSKFDEVLLKYNYVLLTAPGGSGKSSCVTEYAYRMKDKGKEVIFLNSESSEDIYKCYIGLAKEFKITLEGQDNKTLIRSIHQHLENTGKKLLFIFDNSKSYDAIKDYIDYIHKQLPTGTKYIITSRDGKLIDTIEQSQHIELSSHFSFKEAKTYLQKSLKSKNISNQEIDSILDTVSRSPIKISQVVGWFYNKNNELRKVDEYLELYRKGNFDDSESTLLFKDLLQRSTTPKAALLLQYASYLGADFISTEILKQLLHIDDTKLQTHLQYLESQSLIKIVRKKDSGEIGIKIHKEIQKDIIKFIDKHPDLTPSPLPSTDYVYQQLSNVLNDLMPKVDQYPNQNWQAANLISTHAVKMLSLIKDSSQKADLLNKLGLYNHYIVYNREAALKYYQGSEDIYNSLGDRAKQAELLINKGLCYFAKRKLAEAENSFNEALKLIATDSKSKADALSGLAVIYDKNSTGTKPDSLSFHQQAYEIYKKLYHNQDNATIATTLHNIGWYYREKGNENSNEEYLNKALDCFKESFEIRKRLYPDQKHPDIASSLSSEATTYTYLGGKDNLNKALKLHEDVLKIREELFHGQPHQDIINSYFRLGETHKALKHYSKALSFFEKAKDDSYKINHTHNYGPIIASFQKIAEVYEAVGNTAEAIEYYKKGYAIIKRCNYDPNRPENKQLADKVKTYSPEFIDNTELRVFITDTGVVNNKIYDIKFKIQSKILNKLYDCSKNGQWNNGWMPGSYGAKSYLDDGYIKKVLGSDLSSEDLKIAKELCFEAICIGIISTPEAKRNFTCLIEFAHNNSDLLNVIAKQHPKYFVDGSLLIESINKEIISKESVTKVISTEEFKEHITSEKQLPTLTPEATENIASISDIDSLRQDEEIDTIGSQKEHNSEHE
jgi:tetratricopeptide (TPR) repeat protein